MQLESVEAPTVMKSDDPPLPTGPLSSCAFKVRQEEPYVLFVLFYWAAKNAHHGQNVLRSRGDVDSPVPEVVLGGKYERITGGR